MLLSTVVFVLLLVVLVLIHELGHFLAARAAGIRVEEFAFGFPPRLVSFVKNKTRYAINLIPIGGYVKLYGEETKKDSPDAYSAKSVWIRLGVVLAGVVMNLVLAVVAFWIGFQIGMVPVISDPASLGGEQSGQVVITQVDPAGAAAAAGLAPGDQLPDFVSVSSIQEFSRTHQGETVELAYVRDGVPATTSVTLPTGDETPLGVGLFELVEVKLGPLAALRAATIETGKTVVATVDFLGDFFGRLLVKGEVLEGVSGPVGIYSVTDQAVKLGVSYVIQILAILSVNLALLNILPFPALDGGRALFLVIESIARKKVVRDEIEGVIHMVGFVLLLILIALVTYRDILRLG